MSVIYVVMVNVIVGNHYLIFFNHCSEADISEAKLGLAPVEQMLSMINKYRVETEI